MTSIVNQRMTAGLDTIVQASGDSLVGNADWQWPYQLCQYVAASFPAARVEFVDRNPSSPFRVPAVGYLVQAGLGGGPKFTMIRDGIPGETTLAAANRATGMFPVAPHFFIAAWGINDCNNCYPVGDYRSNLTYVCNTAAQNYGAQVAIMTPTWGESNFGVPTPGYGYPGEYARHSRYVARKNGFLIMDTMQNFEDHWTGVGSGGQGNYFAQGEIFHPGREGNFAMMNVAASVLFG